MTKKEKFLKELDSQLFECEFKSEIIEKYASLIDEKLSNGEKITKIINEFGNTDELIEKEVTSRIKRNEFKRIVNLITEKFKKNFGIIKDGIKKKLKKLKPKKRLFKKSKKINIFKKHEKRKFFKKHEIKRFFRKKEKKEIAEYKKCKYSWLILIIQIILFIVLFYISTLFATSVFAFLDGVKFYGLIGLFFFLLLFVIEIINLLGCKRLGYPIKHRLHFAYIVIIFIGLSFSVGYATYDYFKVDYVTDIGEKYALVNKKLEYRLYKNKDMHIYFNSWYKSSYILVEDNKLLDKIRIEVKYYEEFYDLNTVNEGSSIYISLASDYRDLLSIYLDNLKEKKIYNEKEFSRYTIKIYANESDMERLIIHN